jgi:hypothetical protein
MVIQSINTQSTPNTVTVQQLAAIPFELRDDDAATHPFNVDTSLMQNSDNQNQNLFAPAYIRPEYDVLGTGPTQPSFNLNVELNVEVCNQLSSGRDYASTDEYWVAYLQGGFQGGLLRDRDPAQEPTVFGVTATPATPTSTLDQGSLIYVEAIRDFGACSTGINLLVKVTVHEAGHQFGLVDGTGGIMNQGCIPAADMRFTPDHIAAMRGRSHP